MKANDLILADLSARIQKLIDELEQLRKIRHKALSTLTAIRINKGLQEELIKQKNSLTMYTPSRKNK